MAPILFEWLMPRSRRSVPKDPKLQDTLRLSAKGVAMVLGELEHRIMEAAWTVDREATARELHARVTRSHAVEPVTVVTVCNRLVEKGLLRRNKRDTLYHYAATLSREDFTDRVSRHVVERIMALGADAVAASVVDVLAKHDPAQLEELGRLVRRRLKERRSEG